MATQAQQFGKDSESAAVRHLRENGYKILEQNYRTRLGEIDIIAKDRDTIVFVEVKARRSGLYGNPKGAVTREKQRRITMAALCYLKSTRQSRVRARFDVVAIRSDHGTTGIEIIKNAFESSIG